MIDKNPREFWQGANVRPTTVIPSLRYKNARAAIAFLNKAFGFESHLVVDGEGNSVTHAELTYGSGMIMLGSSIDAEVAPASIYVIVDDPDAHCATARAAGAEIVSEPADQDYGGRLYSARDQEGHSWHFGSYDPFAPAQSIQYSEDDETGVIEIRVAGRIDANSFENVVESIESFLQRHESARIVEVIEAFEGMDWSILFDDVLFSLRHMRRFSHVAVVTDLRWAERMTNAAAIVLPARVRLFPLDDLDAARRWVRKASA